jgi:hypothetical protein
VNGRRNIEAICLRYGTRSGIKRIKGGRKLGKSQYNSIAKTTNYNIVGQKETQ